MSRENNSFTYKTINPIVREILDKRSELNQTSQVAIPFVRATTTIEHTDFLGEGNIGFSIGLHGFDSDVAWEDIYSNQDRGQGRKYPLVGYTFEPNGRTKRIYADPPGEQLAFINQFLNQNDTLVETVRVPLLPPPGITSVSVGTNKNAMSLYAQLQIAVPSLIQLEVLYRTFLIPGAGMVVEWGQQFAQEEFDTIGKSGLKMSSEMRQAMFPWHERGRLEIMLEKLATRQIGMDEITQCYSLKSQGQYSWMFGRVANFSTKSNSDGSFDVTVKILGQGEDGFAYLTRDTVRPPADNSGKICSENENSVDSYFGNTVAGGLNFKTLLDAASGRSTELPELDPEWKSHVIYFANGNKSSGETDDQPTNPNVSTAGSGFTDDAYFVTWRFFVNVVLNHPRYGLMAIFDRAFEGLENKNALMNKIALLRPYASGEKRETVLVNAPGDVYLNDPYENYVGNNPYLRSTDIGTMIIVNEEAAKRAEQSEEYKLLLEKNNLLEANNNSKRFLSKGDFYLSANQAPPLSGITNDRGFLSTGVWLNHKKIVECMMTGDTILQGVTNLLDAMSNATGGYWKLALDNSYPLSTGVTCLNPVEKKLTYENDYHNYGVVDVNFKENSIDATKRFLQGEVRVHTFNKYTRSRGNTLLGSELTDCQVDLSLPRALYSAIATVGLFSTKDLDRVNAVGKTPEQLAAEKNNEDAQINPAGCSNTILSNNEALREMFSVVSIAPKNGKSPDRTVIDATISKDTKFTCGQPVAQVTAEAAGGGYQPAPAPAIASPQNQQELKEQQDRRTALERELLSETCSKCLPPPVQITAGPSRVTRYVGYRAIDGSFVRVPVYENYVGAGRTDSPRLFQAGYRNGRAETFGPGALVPAYGGIKLYKEAADQFKRMSAEYAKDNPGKQLAITDGFRDVATQISVIEGKGWTVGPEHATTRSTNGRGLGMAPGTSDHGWGLAIDVDLTPGGVKEWMERRGREFGFFGIQPDINKSESWHYDYRLRIFGEVPPSPGIAPPADQQASPVEPSADSEQCAECQRKAQEYTQLTGNLSPLEQQSDQLTATVRTFPFLNSLYRYMEPLSPKMVNNMRCTSNGVRANAFGSAPSSLAITAQLKMPGIAGLRVGELFWVDRIPSFYKAFGAFQIMSIQHDITREGWLTTIESRFNYLGDEWKNRMLQILGKVISVVNDPVTPSTDVTEQATAQVTAPVTGPTSSAVEPRRTPVQNAQNLQTRPQPAPAGPRVAPQTAASPNSLRSPGGQLQESILNQKITNAVNASKRPAWAGPAPKVPTIGRLRGTN